MLDVSVLHCRKYIQFKEFLSFNSLSVFLVLFFLLFHCCISVIETLSFQRVFQGGLWMTLCVSKWLWASALFVMCLLFNIMSELSTKKKKKELEVRLMHWIMWNNVNMLSCNYYFLFQMIIVDCTSLLSLFYMFKNAVIGELIPLWCLLILS